MVLRGIRKKECYAAEEFEAGGWGKGEWRGNGRGLDTSAVEERSSWEEKANKIGWNFASNGIV